MSSLHKELSSGRWETLTFFEQMANIGSEVERAISWKNKNNEKYKISAFERGLELLTLTMSDKKNNRRLKELARVKESLSDFFIFNNTYNSSDDFWKKYFLAFNYAARSKRG